MWVLHIYIYIYNGLCGLYVDYIWIIYGLYMDYNWPTNVVGGLKESIHHAWSSSDWKREMSRPGQTIDREMLQPWISGWQKKRKRFMYVYDFCHGFVLYITVSLCTIWHMYCWKIMETWKIEKHSNVHLLMVLHVSHFSWKLEIEAYKKEICLQSETISKAKYGKKPAESADKGWQRLGTTVGARLVDELVDSTTNKMMISYDFINNTSGLSAMNMEVEWSGYTGKRLDFMTKKVRIGWYLGWVSRFVPSKTGWF